MKYIIILTAVAALLLGLSGCSRTEHTGGSAEDIYIIAEYTFSEQILDIMLNYEDFLGRTIRYQGMFIPMYWPDTSESFYYIARLVDSCCEPGGIVGFEVYLNHFPVLEEYTWVEVTGVFEQVYIENYGYIFKINATSMVALDEPGKRYVHL